MATIVYVDGFNLYYGALKNSPDKWLDLSALCALLLPKDDIKKIRYFTAKVKSRPDDPLQALRQHTYLRALGTFPEIEVHFGHYETRRRRMPLASPPTGGPRTVEVLKTEEKGSDVNLASYLMLDAFKDACDTAVVMTNDSDLAEPIRLVLTETRVQVGVVNPHPAKSRSHRLQGLQGTFFKQLRPNAPSKVQLPPVLQDANGTISKPSSW